MKKQLLIELISYITLIITGVFANSYGGPILIVGMILLSMGISVCYIFLFTHWFINASIGVRIFGTITYALIPLTTTIIMLKLPYHNVFLMISLAYYIIYWILMRKHFERDSITEKILRYALFTMNPLIYLSVFVYH